MESQSKLLKLQHVTPVLVHTYPPSIYLENSWPMCEICSKLTIDPVLASLLLTLNRFHTLLWCFHHWLWTSNCRLSRNWTTLNHHSSFILFLGNIIAQNFQSKHVFPASIRVHRQKISEFFNGLWPLRRRGCPPGSTWPKIFETFWKKYFLSKIWLIHEETNHISNRTKLSW